MLTWQSQQTIWTFFYGLGMDVTRMLLGRMSISPVMPPEQWICCILLIISSSRAVFGHRNLEYWSMCFVPSIPVPNAEACFLYQLLNFGLSISTQ